jgi:hypothetical protein
VVVPELGLTVGQLAVYLTINARRRNSKKPKKPKKKKACDTQSENTADVKLLREAPSSDEGVNESP